MRPARSLADERLIPCGVWTSHNFPVRHLGISHVHGKFDLDVSAVKA
jgi:hypothetical protein